MIVDPAGAVDGLLACVAARIDPAACRVHVTAGAPALDGCCDGDGCDGQLTANLQGLVNVDQNLRRSAGQTPCRPGNVAADVRVVLARCHPTLDAGGTPPSADDLAAAGARLADDAAALWTAMTCCTPWPTAVTSVDVALPPSGGCIVLVGSVLVDLDAG